MGGVPGSPMPPRFLVVSGMTTYARRLGLFSGTMAVVGGIIGGGIFRTPATVAERLRSPGLVLLAWVIGGLVARVDGTVYDASITRQLQKMRAQLGTGAGVKR